MNFIKGGVPLWICPVVVLCLVIFLMILFESLEMKELSAANLNLKRLYSETVASEPILIIISAGADPSQELQELANEVTGGEHYHQVCNLLCYLMWNTRNCTH